MPWIYKFFGLTFSCNLPLPGIPPENSLPESVDVLLHLGSPARHQDEPGQSSEELIYISEDTNDQGVPILRIWKTNPSGCVHLGYEDGTQFWLDHGLKNVWAAWPSNLPVENASSYLLGPVLGLLLRLKGTICLHASAVAIKNRVVAFAGPPGAGKSTTAAAFSRLGHSVLSDDITALEERDGSFRVQPAPPQVCLWPESVSMLYGAPGALPLLNPRWEKRRLAPGDREAGFEKDLLPLAAVYLIGARLPQGKPFVKRMPAQSALLSLVADSYANKLLSRDLRAHEFQVLGRLATIVPIRQVHAVDGGDQLGELCQVILEDVDALPESVSNVPRRPT